MSAAFATDGSNLDGMAPPVAGAHGGRGRYRDVLTEGAHPAASDYQVTIGEPVHDETTGDAADVVLPATMTFDLKRHSDHPDRRDLHGGTAPRHRRATRRGVGKGQAHAVTDATKLELDDIQHP